MVPGSLIPSTIICFLDFTPTDWGNSLQTKLKNRVTWKELLNPAHNSHTSGRIGQIFVTFTIPSRVLILWHLWYHPEDYKDTLGIQAKWWAPQLSGSNTVSSQPNPPCLIIIRRKPTSLTSKHRGKPWIHDPSPKLCIM